MKLALFASGTGSNVANLIEHLGRRSTIVPALVLANRSCGAIEIAEKKGIQTYVFTKEELASGAVLNLLRENNIEGVVLAGFLLKMPSDIIAGYKNKIVNVHPSLLPKHGGKGMYGLHVHQAVINAGEKETGITIHLVNEQYDEGKILAQFLCEVLPNDTPELLQERVKELEKSHFPKTVETYFSKISV